MTGPRTVDPFAPLLRVLQLLEDVDVRLGGGWGIDDLAGRVTRDHQDVDLFVADVSATVARLVGASLTPVLEEPPHRVVLGAPASCAPPSGMLADVNGLAYRPGGDALQRVHAGRSRSSVRGRGPTAGSAVGRWSASAPRRSVSSTAATRRARRTRPISRPSPTSTRRRDSIRRSGRPSTEKRTSSTGSRPPPTGCTSRSACGRCRRHARGQGGRSRPHPLHARRRLAVGFCRVEVFDGHAHVGQVSVLPEVGGLGIGSALVEEACRWATREGHGPVTLTTFTGPPFNAPWYRRLGFEPLDPPYGPELSEVVAGEAELAALGPRAVMVRRVGSWDSAARA